MKESRYRCGQQYSTCPACESPGVFPGAKQTIFVNWVVLDRVNKTVMKGKSSLVADMEDLNTTSHTPIDSIKQQERPLQNVNQIMSSLP